MVRELLGIADVVTQKADNPGSGICFGAIFAAIGLMIMRSSLKAAQLSRKERNEKFPSAWSGDTMKRNPYISLFVGTAFSIIGILVSVTSAVMKFFL